MPLLTPELLRRLAQVQLLAALRHRLILSSEAEAEGITTDHIIAQVLQEVPRNAEAVKT
jgi:MoxR-like ATPase